jgi:hypothetical protein
MRWFAVSDVCWHVIMLKNSKQGKSFRNLLELILQVNQTIFYFGELRPNETSIVLN